MVGYHKYMRISFLLMISFLFLFFTLPVSLALQVGFYSYTCPNAENIVREVVQQRFASDKTIAAALLRMHFHDCFVRGCDASILLDSTNTTQAEKTAGPNLSVREFALIDQIKTKLEAACPQTVSCADVIALATRDSIALVGGPKYTVPTGRRDGFVSQASDVNLPGPTFTVSQAQQSFAAKGMTLNDMVVLLGGHTIGVAQCGFFQDRLSNFQGTGASDPTLDKALLNKLKGVCTNSNANAFLDQKTPFVFDNQYYNQIKSNKGVLQIDQELALDPSSSKLVSSLAANNGFFTQSFVNAIIKVGNIQVLQGTAGEIRTNCRKKN